MTTYSMLPFKLVNKLMNLFINHHAYVNEEFNEFKSESNYCNSDRDRFVYHALNKFMGKYIVIIDRIIIGWRDNISEDKRFWVCEPISKFNPQFNEHAGADPIIRYKKKYLSIRGFSAVNKMYGEDYIEMSCFDIYGNCVKLKLTHNNLLYLQFNEITKMEFDMMSKLFEDDRENRQYKVKRFVKTETLNNRKKPKTVITEEEIIVMAKDEIEARNSITNVLSVTRVE